MATFLLLSRATQRMQAVLFFTMIVLFACACCSSLVPLRACCSSPPRRSSGHAALRHDSHTPMRFLLLFRAGQGTLFTTTDMSVFEVTKDMLLLCEPDVGAELASSSASHAYAARALAQASWTMMFSRTAQKALEKELEVMQRKKNFVIEMANAEASFNELARKKESDLQAKQHIEEMKLMEESEKERAAIMDEWLEKSKTEKGKRENEPSPSLEEEVSSCCMCTDPLVDGKNRAVLPCGHARLCLECADLVFESEQPLCPFCRKKITKKPIVLPKMFE